MSRILAAFAVLALCAAPLLAADAPPAPAAAPAAKPDAAPAAKTAAKTAAKKTKTASSGASDAFKTEDGRTFPPSASRVGQTLSSTPPPPAEANAIAQGLKDAITGKPEAVSMAVYLPKVGEMANKRLTAKAE